MGDISLTIDGKRISCAAGTSILEAAEQNGIRIPRLCYHHELEPYGACRICLVEDSKTGRLMASCVTPASANMEILTDTPRIKRHRTNIVRLMMAEHPESCVVCSKGNRCQLREIAADLGLGYADLYAIPNYKPLEQANSFISRDLSKCILCGKCIRADHELVVAGAIDYNLRGFRSRPATLHDLPLEQSSCTFCGTCVSICPTGALAPINTRWVGTPEGESHSTCGFCGIGCSIVVGQAGGKAIETNPSHLPGSVNGATLCVRGHFAHDFLNADERLTQPMLRKEDGLLPSSWGEALDTVAKRLLEIKGEYGPQSIALFGSSKCSNEENYLFQKIARVLLGTNNVDNGGYMGGRPAIDLIEQRTDGRCHINPLKSLLKAESILILGADPSHSTPVLSYYLKRASRKGVPMVLVDPRRTDLVSFSSIWLPVSPGKDTELVNCLAALLWKNFSNDQAFVERFTEGFGSYRDGLSSFNLERLCVAAGIDMASMKRAAEILKGKKIALVLGDGITHQKDANHCIDALLNLSLMTGSLASEKGWIYLLSKENNDVGAWDMGSVPHVLPGRQPLGEDGVRQKWERFWKTKISPDQGLNVIRMIEEAEKGNLKALYVMGENPLRSLPQGERVREALERLDLLVVQDILANETSQIAHVVLPGAASCEKAGSFTNMEGRIQPFEPVVSPPGDAKPDWEILDILGEKMGFPRRYGSLGMVRSEISRAIPMYKELNGQRDEGWVKETSKKALFSFTPVASAPYGTTDGNYRLTAVMGSLRYHLGSGTRTSHSERIRGFELCEEVQVSHEDGAKLDIRDGETVRIVSPQGAVARKVRLERSLRAGLVFLPRAFHGNDARNLIPLTPIERIDWPGWNTCQVRLEKV
ncbi:MAG: molybdopterin-dependent oxidoreductase [Pseudomonadota bacterium]